MIFLVLIFTLIACPLFGNDDKTGLIQTIHRLEQQRSEAIKAQKKSEYISKLTEEAFDRQEDLQMELIKKNPNYKYLFIFKDFLKKHGLAYWPAPKEHTVWTAWTPKHRAHIYNPNAPEFNPSKAD